MGDQLSPPAHPLPPPQNHHRNKRLHFIVTLKHSTSGGLQTRLSTSGAGRGLRPGSAHLALPGWHGETSKLELLTGSASATGQDWQTQAVMSGIATATKTKSKNRT